MLSYPATLDVPESIAHTICLWLAAHRRAHDMRPWQRAATCRVQAVLLLRWMVAGTALTTLARDSKVSRATAYRYLHEALGVIADRAPDLPEVLDRLRRSKEPNAGLDGTLIRTDRVAQRNPDTGRHLWYSGKGKAFGGNVQVVMDFRRVPRVHGPGGARLHPRPDRGQTPCAAGPVPVRMAGDAGPGGQGVSGRGDRRADPHEEPLPDTGRGDPQQPAVRHAGPGREGQCHVQALQGLAARLPRPRDHHHDHGRRPRHHHPLARFLTRILVRKAHYLRLSRVAHRGAAPASKRSALQIRGVSCSKL